MQNQLPSFNSKSSVLNSPLLFPATLHHFCIFNRKIENIGIYVAIRSTHTWVTKRAPWLQLPGEQPRDPSMVDVWRCVSRLAGPASERKHQVIHMTRNRWLRAVPGGAARLWVCPLGPARRIRRVPAAVPKVRAGTLVRKGSAKLLGVVGAVTHVVPRVHWRVQDCVAHRAIVKKSLRHRPTATSESQPDADSKWRTSVCPMPR